jgi:iron(III) transport system substrate-binding protein
MRDFPPMSVALFFLFFSLMAIPWARAQSDQTAKLIDGAKKEGQVIVYGTMSLADANQLNAKFREKYPFVDVKLNRLGSGKFVPRVLAEVRANKHLADILQTNSLGLHFLKKEGFLGQYLSSEDRFFPNKFKDQGYWTTTNMNVHVVAFNPKLVAREKLPKTFDDLLNPVWKGRMVLDASEQWSALMFQIMGKEKAIKYMRELAKQNILLRRESNAMRAQLIAAGEAPMDIDSTLGPVAELKKRGAPIDWITLGPVPVVTSAHALAARGPNPNAARLYLDFILSKEGQRAVLNVGRQVARTDLLAEQEAIKNLDLVPLDPRYGESMDYHANLTREIFQQ